MLMEPLVDLPSLIHIVDDDPMSCQALARLFASVGLESRLYASPLEFLHAFDHGRCGCILIDVRLPGMSGLELQAQINERGWTHPVLFVTGHPEVGTAVRAMKAGAIDFLPKPVNEQALLEAVTAACKQHVERVRADQRLSGIRERLNSLSPREREILELVAQGRSTKQIAMGLGLSHKTVDNHRANILEKMQAESAVELVRLFLLAEPEFESR